MKVHECRLGMINLLQYFDNSMNNLVRHLKYIGKLNVV